MFLGKKSLYASQIHVITLISNPDKTTTRKKNYRPFMNIDLNILSKILNSYFSQFIKIFTFSYAC